HSSSPHFSFYYRAHHRALHSFPTRRSSDLPQIVDGSGLSRADRTTPRQVVRLIELMNAQAVGPAFESSFPVAGRTGTLRRRMRGTIAQDRCHAKTGTLVAVSALAGYCDTTGGHRVAFAILMGTTRITRAHGI